MAKNRIICTTNEIDYSSIRKAMCQGGRSVEDMMAMANVCSSCEGCQNDLPPILSSVCGCKGVALQTVVDAVKAGATSVEEIVLKTGAGSADDCGRCKVLIENVLLLGR